MSPAGRKPLRCGVAAVALALLCAAASPVRACPLPAPQAGEKQIMQGGVQLRWRGEPEPLAVGRPFAVAVQLCPPTARLVRVDATMPEHRHGMNYRPTVTPVGEGRWRAEGLLWHMAGRWEMAFEVESGGERAWLRQSVPLP